MSMRRHASAPALAAPLLSIARLWRARAGGLGLGLLVSLLAFLCGLALLAASGLRLAGASVGLLLVSASLLRAFGAGRVALRYAERLLTHAATFKALADLRVWFFRNLAVGAAGGLGFRRTGDALSRLVDDVEALDGLYLRMLLPLGAAVVALPLLGVLVGERDPLLAAAIVALFAASTLLLPWMAARIAAAQGSRLADAAAGLRIACLDVTTGLREIHAFAAAAAAAARVQSRQAVLIAAQARLARQGAAAGLASFLCGQAAILCVLAAALGWGFARLSGTEAVLFLFLLLAVFDSTTGLVRAGVLAGHMAHAATRILEIVPHRAGPALARPASASPAPANLQPGGDMAVRFEAVRFRWQPDRAAVFDGLTLQIPPGARIALLGASGAGKSTLAALLLRVAAPQSGRITLGGIDLAALDETALRGRIAWLGQQSHLFDDSIRSNLLLGRPEASEAELWSALEQAQIADFVRGLPEGLESWLGESGARVSGGQGRRVALARVLLSAAPILILDEPAAGLDAETERDFLLTLNRVAAGRTLILIAHRLLGVEQLDRVWRLADGRAVAVA